MSGRLSRLGFLRASTPTNGPSIYELCPSVGHPETKEFLQTCGSKSALRARDRVRLWCAAIPFGRFYSFAAASRVAMSNFTIFIIAAIAFGCFRISPIFSGTICQHRPNLSVSQPQAMGLPPSSSLSQ